MTALQQAKEQLAEMLKKYPIDSELSVELQTLYTLIEAQINSNKK